MYKLYKPYVQTVQATCTDRTSYMYSSHMPRLLFDTAPSVFLKPYSQQNRSFALTFCLNHLAGEESTFSLIKIPQTDHLNGISR